MDHTLDPAGAYYRNQFLAAHDSLAIAQIQIQGQQQEIARLKKELEAKDSEQPELPMGS